jgi:hypothetical protein
MAEKPILFSTEMVKAILNKQKTQTRRVVTRGVVGRIMNGNQKLWPYLANGQHVNCPYGKPADLLWVRETWQAVSPDEDERPINECEIIYKATDEHPGLYNPDKPDDPWYGWRPSIFMPRWASRLTLRVDNVRVERLQSITNMDAEQEGVDADTIFLLGSARYKFMDLWNKINANRGYSWDSNPWVWVIEFMPQHFLRE